MRHVRLFYLNSICKMSRLIKIVCLFGGLFSALPSFAQDNLPWGRDFWVVPYSHPQSDISIEDAIHTGYVEKSLYKLHVNFSVTTGFPTIVTIF